VRSGLFTSVPGEDMRLVLAVARRRTFARNEVVFPRGEPADSLHIVTEGRFAVRVATRFGDSATLALRGPGEVFGELALLSAETTRSATVSALEPGETQSVNVDDFTRLRRRHPGVNEMMLVILSSQLRRTNELLLEFLYLPAEQRVRRRLQELAEVYAGGAVTAVIPLTQVHLAGLAGTSRETVNRVLRAEAARGTIEVGRGRIVVLDARALGDRSA
jgi:CRP/FNR family transcriptional regulator, cyclic AMP receptor protein